MDLILHGEPPHDFHGSITVDVFFSASNAGERLHRMGASSSVQDRGARRRGGEATRLQITSAGLVAYQNATLAATATAGTNGAPPAQVSGYLEVVVNGTTVKIPYYNV